MVNKCAYCGKQFDVLWPHLWRYKCGTKKYLCSYGCMRKYDGKDDKTMARMKKDGTPAKRPGPKPRKADVPAPIAGGDWEKIPAPAASLKLDGAVRIETPEAKNVQVVEVPEGIVKGPVSPDELYEKFGENGWKEIKEVSRPPEYRVTGISTEAGDFQYFKKSGYLDWTTPTGETVSMSLEEWKELMRIWPFVLKVLGVEL